RLSIGVPSFCNSRFSQHDAAFAKTVHSFVVSFSRHNCIRQTHDCNSEFFVRGTVVLGFHRSLASRECRFAFSYAGLTSLYFALGNVFRGLREARYAKKEKARRDQTENNKGRKNSNKWRGEFARAYNVANVSAHGVATLCPPRGLR